MHYEKPFNALSVSVMPQSSISQFGFVLAPQSQDDNSAKATVTAWTSIILSIIIVWLKVQNQVMQQVSSFQPRTEKPVRLSDCILMASRGRLL